MYKRNMKFGPQPSYDRKSMKVDGRHVSQKYSMLVSLVVRCYV
jgi:hypothetical protein